MTGKVDRGWLERLGVHRPILAAGRRLLQADHYRMAEAYLRYAARIAPFDARIWLALGTCLHCRHKPVSAISLYEKALALDPQIAEAEERIGHAAVAASMWPLAITQFSGLLAKHPDSPQFHYYLANAYAGDGQLHAALEHYRAALAMEEVASTHNGLGLVLSEMGRQAESLPHFRRAAELSTQPSYISNLLFTLCYDDTLSPQALYQLHCEQAARLPAEVSRRWRQSFDPERKLRIGYISPDMRLHPVAFFIEPILAAHNHERFDIYVYATQQQLGGEVAQRLRALVDFWRDFDDPESPLIADHVLADQIDILVDLAGHTGNNSLPLLATRLAPVQVSWLGYLNTTGLKTMDYRLTDAVASPPAFAQALHCEKLAYLPASQWCYRAPPEAGAVSAAPSASKGHVTFGALHNPAKVGGKVIELWARVLKAVPDARLLIVARGFERLADETRARFAALGVAPDRIEIRDRVALEAYFALHGEIDINLDSFPYTGGTTSCHSLWMGVPVLTLACPTVMGRGGASLLSQIGMADWIAESEDAFVELAVRHAGNPAGLAELRSQLRDRMAVSALMDAPAFTQALEAAYRQMWFARCGQATSPS
ncbi:tetratricopeptide repeat protein [Chitinimonas sp. BJYL2]|uniref:O-linked N-acetylglucosamine transferase, SPINDLY family protein n=1 Tax=Chitinimonas sp. BJYL2 TaxID=2976696 RepID=UPI0022B5AA00|nr:tetratricopeptide repeat protein [Chitinimonas sp. BJYL2]